MHPSQSRGEPDNENSGRILFGLLGNNSISPAENGDVQQILTSCVRA